MLALAERRALDEGLNWVFCDTDSLAISKPESLDRATFLMRALAVCDWFKPLNPYDGVGAEKPSIFGSRECELFARTRKRHGVP